MDQYKSKKKKIERTKERNFKDILKLWLQNYWYHWKDFDDDKKGY